VISFTLGAWVDRLQRNFLFPIKSYLVPGFLKRKPFRKLHAPSMSSHPAIQTTDPHFAPPRNIRVVLQDLPEA